MVSFLDLRILSQRKIHVYSARTPQKCRLPKVPGATADRTLTDGPTVNVAGDRLIRGQNQVGPLAAGNGVSGLVESDGHVPRRPTLRGQIAADRNL